MNIGWAFAFACLGIPVLGIAMATFSGWMNYRHRRAALETLKAYAASGRDPPEALIRALTRPEHPNAHGGPWQSDDSYDEDVVEPAEPAPRGSKAEFRMRARARRWRYRRSAERAWRECFGWVGLAGGFWAAATYVATGKSQSSLLIVSYILGAVAIASLLGAILTTIARANDRQPD